MKKYAPAAAVFVLVLALGTLAPAQGTLQGDPQARMRIRENISNLYLLRLTRALELTEEQTARVYPLLTRVEKDKAVIQRRMGQDLRDLRAELAKPGAGEQPVLGLVARIREARSDLRRKDDEVEEPGTGQRPEGADKKNPLTRISISSRISLVVLYISD
jgi:hypothetical protein